jgi:non-specific serine/threonine protein kinase
MMYEPRENGMDNTRSFVPISKGTMISHYKIMEKIGAGGMGEVYLAEDTELNRKVALKFLPPHLCQDEDCRARFKREAQAAAKLNHPNIVTIYEVGDYNGRPYFAMEHVEGRALKDVIKKDDLSIQEIVDFVMGICEGLKKAHQAGIVHRDIKPSNIVIDADGRPKLLDFGLAAIRGSEKLTISGSTLGTIGYMSPEQIEGKDIDRRSDLFSLGVVFYEMITGQAPFKGDSEAATLNSILNDIPQLLSKYRADIPDSLQKIVDKALNKDLEARYQAAAGIISDLIKLKKELESGSSATQPQPSIAVLPFTNMSADPEQEYFCDGMAEDIINDLTHVEGLRVAARTSAFAFKGKQEDIRDIGRKLNVETLLEGSVRKAGNQLRITAQLINVSDGYHLWSERYDRELKDVFAIQDEIARSIVQALKVKLSRKEKRALEKVATNDIQAYDYYLRGRKFFYQLNKMSIEFALKMFSRAIEKDPGYALAYAGKADCHSFLFMYLDSRQENVEQSLAASQKALELDSELAEAHAASGLAVSLNKQYNEAEKEFETAIRLNPKLFEAYHFYARTSFVQGKLERASQLFKQASLVNPDDYQSPILLAGVYKGLNLEAEAETAYRRGFEIAERHLELNPDDARAYYLGAGALHNMGEKEKSLEWANKALSIGPDEVGVLYNTACLFSNLGNTKEAIDYLERAVEKGYAMKEWIENDSDFDPIRSHPRFQALLKKME